ncbi:MAG: hypothetical protein K0B06_10790 [Brevefilum sp.]|nr:hypothetical protein [Brevefilum sp.]
MTFTYTYTARDKDNPNTAMTFTIYDDFLKVDLTGLGERITEIIDEDRRQDAFKDMIITQAGTTLYYVLERLSGPVHIKDVTPSFNDGIFTLTFWKRLVGLRFAPVVVSMGEVDNPEAAEQFIETLEDRQGLTETPGIFAGPLDYWITWIAMLIGVILLIRWPRRKKS